MSKVIKNEIIGELHFKRVYFNIINFSRKIVISGNVLNELWNSIIHLRISFFEMIDSQSNLSNFLFFLIFMFLFKKKKI